MNGITRWFFKDAPLSTSNLLGWVWEVFDGVCWKGNFDRDIEKKKEKQRTGKQRGK